MSIHERVKSLIQDSGCTQAQFGERSGIEQTKFSKSLRGLRNFTSLEIATLARDNNVSVDWLLTGEDDEWSAAARSGSDRVSADGALRKAREYVTMRRDLREFGIIRPWKLDTVAGPKGRRWVEQGQAMAHEARRVIRDAHSDGDLPALIEQAFQIDVAIQDLGGLDGIAVSTDSARLIAASPSTVPGRQRFTLMHELAHLLASDDQQLHQDVDVFAKGGEGEVRANAFAAEILMPSELLETRVSSRIDDDQFAQLTWELQVSPSALAYRLCNCGLIDEATRDHWRQFTAQICAERSGESAGYLQRVAQASQTRVPALLVADAFVAYNEGHTTLRPVARLLGVEPGDLRSQLDEGNEI